MLIALFIWLTATTAPSQAQTANPETIYQEDFEDQQAQGWNLEPDGEYFRMKTTRFLQARDTFGQIPTSFMMITD